MTWFVTAHILIYTSIHTCRLSAPHLWWLTFGIICIGYLVIVEVIVVAFLIFILGPLIFVCLPHYLPPCRLTSLDSSSLTSFCGVWAVIRFGSRLRSTPKLASCHTRQSTAFHLFFTSQRQLQNKLPGP